MSNAAKTPPQRDNQSHSPSEALLLEQYYLIERTPFDRRTKDFLREVARESSRCEGRCSKPIAEIASRIQVSVRQAQRIAKSAVQRGLLDRQDQPGRPSSFWLRSVALQDKALAASDKPLILDGPTDPLVRVTRRVRGDGVGRGDIFSSHSKSQLTNRTDERVLLREIDQGGLFEILDIDQERLRNKEKQGARLAELRYEEAARPRGACELVEFLDATIKFLPRVGIRYPRVFLKRLRQIRRGQFVPRQFAGISTSRESNLQTWGGIAEFRDKLRPAIACLWESYTRGMDDIPFHERVGHFLNELDCREIPLKSHERTALKNLAASACGPCIPIGNNNSILPASATEGNEATESNDVEEG